MHQTAHFVSLNNQRETTNCNSSFNTFLDYTLKKSRNKHVSAVNVCRTTGYYIALFSDELL